MKAHLILFSPTGGTEKAARLLCGSLADTTEVLDLTEPAWQGGALTASPEDVAVIAMPSYGGRVPGLAAERLKKLRGDGMACVLLCVYGNRAYEDTLAEMEDLAELCGFAVIGAVAAIAEHSILRQFAAGRPDSADEENLVRMGGQLREKVVSGNLTKPAIPGNRPYKKAGGGMVPKATSDCVHCGLCARKCPARAISAEDVKKTDSKLCIGCMRCTVVCPHGARKLNGMMTTAVAAVLKKACAERKECELYL